MSGHPYPSGDDTGRRGYEHRASSPRPIVFSAILLVLGIVVSLVVCAVLAAWFDRRYGRVDDPALRTGDRRPPAPALQIDPAFDLQRLHQHEEPLLRGQSDGGAPRISIEDAMARVARGERAAQPVEVPPAPPRPAAPAAPRPQPLPETVGGGHAPEGIR